MDLFSITLQIISWVIVGFTIAGALFWLKETKIGKYVIAFFIWPYLIWIFHKLSKDEYLIKLQNRIEREKITYYF